MTWDIKCTCCEWTGTVDEAEYDPTEDCYICPVCGDTEMEQNSEKP